MAFGGFSSFYWAILRRELEFRRSFAGQLVQVIAMAVASVALAALGAGVWSLVVGQIVGMAAYTLALAFLAPYRIRPALDLGIAPSLWRSSRGFMLQGGFSFIEQNTDYLVVGSVLGSRPLGVYSMAYRLTELPYNAIVDPIGQTTFPGFARMRHRGEDVRGPFLTSLRLVALCGFPIGVLLAGAAVPFVHAILGPKWEGVIGVLPILGLWGSVRTLQGRSDGS